MQSAARLRFERLSEICADVVDVLDANRDANHVLRDARRGLLFGRELLVRRRRGVNDERLGVTDVSQVRCKLDVVDELHSRIETTLHAKREHGAIHARAEVLARLFVERMRRQTRVRHPADLRMLFQVLRQRHGVLAVAFHAQGKRFQAQDKVERAKRRLAHAEIAQPFDARAHDERRIGAQNTIRTERIPKFQSVVARRRLSHHRVLTVVPVHRTAVNDDAADRRTVAANPLGRGLNNDICTMLQRLAHVSTRTKRIIADQRNTMLGRDRLQSLEIRHRKSRVPNRLHVQRLGVGVNLRLKRRRIIILGKLHVNPKSGKRHLELIVRPTIQRRRRDNILPDLTNCRNAQELRRLPARHRERAHAAFQRRHALFKHIIRRIHNSRINVPKRAQSKQIRPVLGRIKRIRRCRINWHRARIRRRIGRLSGVHLQRFKLQFRSHGG
mmetsp:Transcript_373/g.1076  ORF Transcript_373/g.1076 Transcript_373/m.1076 type:complete len:443 (+) Transcript_373:144-1472(+)